MSIQTVGLIGVGLMGHGIGKNILAKGFKLQVLAHKNRGPIESLKGFGAQEAASIAALVQASDILIICVTGSPQVEAVMRGADGVFAQGKKVSFASGRTLFREGDGVNDVYCLTAGNVVVTRLGENGERQILALFRD